MKHTYLENRMPYIPTINCPFFALTACARCWMDFDLRPLAKLPCCLLSLCAVTAICFLCSQVYGLVDVAISRRVHSQAYLIEFCRFFNRVREQDRYATEVIMLYLYKRWWSSSDLVCILLIFNIYVCTFYPMWIFEVTNVHNGYLWATIHGSMLAKCEKIGNLKQIPAN